MLFEGGKKSSRIPLNQEQVKEIIAYKKQKQLVAIQKLKKTKRYRVLNIFNVIAVIVYCEIIFCMYGPATYEVSTCVKANIDSYGEVINGKRSVDFMTIADQNQNRYKFYVGEYIQLPKPNSEFYIGKDYLLRKEIKVLVSTSEEEYIIWRITPLIFLGIFVTAITMLVFFNNMNMINYSLIAVSLMNGINLFYFIFV